MTQVQQDLIAQLDKTATPFGSVRWNVNTDKSDKDYIVFSNSLFYNLKQVADEILAEGTYGAAGNGTSRLKVRFDTQELDVVYFHSYYKQQVLKALEILDTFSKDVMTPRPRRIAMVQWVFQLVIYNANELGNLKHFLGEFFDNIKSTSGEDQIDAINQYTKMVHRIAKLELRISQAEAMYYVHTADTKQIDMDLTSAIKYRKDIDTMASFEPDYVKPQLNIGERFFGREL